MNLMISTASLSALLVASLSVLTPGDAVSGDFDNLPARATAATPAASEVERLTTTALTVLNGQVAVQSHSAALRYAFEAYFNYRKTNPEKVRKPYLYFVDFGLSSTEARGYVFDMDQLRIIEGPFTVAHGSGSASRRVGIPDRFSNDLGSNSTSLGLFVAEETYDFRGRSGGRRYGSVGLRLDGVSGHFNNAARRRGIVAHGAPYVSATRAGRSQGCPAMEPERAERLLPMLSGGSLVFLFSPNDTEWLNFEPWVNRRIDPLRQPLSIATFL